MPGPRPSVDSSDHPAAPRLRVLVVDGMRDAADSLGDLLTLTGAEARVCYDAPTALATAAEFRPDAGVFEPLLPGADGFDLARRVRAAAAGRPLLLVALTVLGGETEVRRATAAGFDLHLIKPADPPALLAALAAFARTRGA
jgi:DNA-binding response OmpR family regulator